MTGGGEGGAHAAGAADGRSAGRVSLAAPAPPPHAEEALCVVCTDERNPHREHATQPIIRPGVDLPAGGGRVRWFQRCRLAHGALRGWHASSVPRDAGGNLRAIPFDRKGPQLPFRSLADSFAHPAAHAA
jgi:hypothetical protein